MACNTSTKIIEAIQSRCAILRFTRLSDKELLARIMEVIRTEEVREALVVAVAYRQELKCNAMAQVPYNETGLEAILFTADGDMRQAINNLQATYTGFGYVSADNVFKVRMPRFERWWLASLHSLTTLPSRVRALSRSVTNRIRSW